MTGFGATFTDSSAWLVQNKLTSTARSTLMNNLFGSNGIALNFLRQPMGATDFIINGPNSYFSYDDNPPGGSDPTLANFSIAHDNGYVIPSLTQALAINPNIKVMLTSWTAPAWMKSNTSLIGGGTLNASQYQTYANYYKKAIAAYTAAGVPIWATSGQNEPSVGAQTPSSGNYPSMTWTSAQQADFIKNYLQPTLSTAGFNPLILAGDSVCFDAAYATSVLNDPTNPIASIAGSISEHGYCGLYSQMSTLHASFPSLGIYQTELSPSCQPREPGDVVQPIDLGIQSARNWAKTMTSWNVALDTDHGPFHTGGTSACTGLVTIDQSTGAVTYNFGYYQEGQLSKFVASNAYRIASNSYGAGGVQDVAFKNPDGTKVLVAHNTDVFAAHTFKVRWGKESFTTTLPAGAIGTYSWSGTQGAAVTPATNTWGNSTYGTDSGTIYAGGLQTGTWAHLSQTATSSTALGAGWASTYNGDASLTNDVVTADLQHVTSGTTSAYPKYGIYAAYHDVTHYVQAFIDPGSCLCFVAHVRNNTDDRYFNTALPTGFDASAWHTIKVVRAAASFTFNLDGELQDQHSDFDIGAAQMGLVTEDTTANYQNVSMTSMPTGWGASAVGDVAVGSWTTTSPTIAASTSLGSGWHTIWRGDATLTKYTVSSELQKVGSGTSSAFPKYGIYAAYADANHLVQAFIDPGSCLCLVVHVHNGTDDRYFNTPLPSGFVATNWHTLSVTRSGSTFTFFVDGSQLDQHTDFSLGGGQVGSVTEDTTANYRNFLTPTGWGDSISTDKQIGSWALLDAKSANSTSLGAGWHATFRGSTSSSYRMTAQVKRLSAGTSSAYPKYGIYASYTDPDHFVQAFIDPGSCWCYVTHIRNGTDDRYINSWLPEGFNASTWHTIDVVRSGSSFTFYLDDTVRQTQTFSVPAGQIGLVTEDSTASYRAVGVI
ncbi:MAG: hypothetical protein M3Z50_01700 [Actinomycetota bacterium]|nr:hypothetical protein [Actinomycetota bacterium]